MYTTDTISPILGYPRDMWVGRSFIDFVHPKDRNTFTEQIAAGISQPFGDQLKVINSSYCTGRGVTFVTSGFFWNFSKIKYRVDMLPMTCDSPSHSASYGVLGIWATRPKFGGLVPPKSPPLSRFWACLLYTSPSPRDRQKSRMPSSA